MTYPEFFVAPMRQELTGLGVRELRTAAEVDAVVGRQLGQPGDQQGPTVMVIVNSVCGCAAGKARPAWHWRSADQARCRGHGICRRRHRSDRSRAAILSGAPPSSPSIALLRDGKLLWMLERRNIENQSAEMIAKNLTDAFDKYCSPATVKA